MVSRCTRAIYLWAALIAAGASASAAQDSVPQDSAAQDPNSAAAGIYTECVMGMSWTCLQRKALLFIDRMGKAERVPLIADGVVSLVRTGPPQPDMSEDSLRSLNSDSLGELVDTSIYDFFQSHVFRFELPSWLRGGSDEQQRSDSAVDFYVGDTVEEGRKKGGLGGGGGGHGHGGGGGGKKGMKKMMMMICMMGVSKMMMLVPMMLGLTKMMAMKALIMGFISLTISKIMILKKLKSKQGGGGGSSGWSSGGGSGGWSSGGGGGGGGWQSGGGGGSGGWDRSFSHDLAYQGHIDNSA